MKSLIIFLSLSVFFVTAQEPQHCASPATWHSRLVREETSQGTHELIEGSFAYDEINQRYRIFEEEFTHDGYHRNVTARYYFYEEKTMYKAYFDTEKCDKMLLNDSFRPIKIPYDAKWIDRVEIGSNAGTGTGVSVDIWQQEIADLMITSVWTTKDCIPVEDRYFSRTFSIAVQTSFFNVEEGLNPGDFVPPKFCNYPPPPK